MPFIAVLILFLFIFCPTHRVAADRPPNIIFVLCDDHRYDCLGSENHPFLETPHLDKLAADGVTMKRAYVTTSLCSPSRASILTGLYAHNHRVVDNYHPVDPELTFFPQLLQATGYQTAFIGKWHMGGDIDDPQRGFDHWVSFKGQGTYFPDGHGTTREVPQTMYDGFNVNGQRVEQKGYITDELTDYAVDWLDNVDRDKPFFMYVSHKAVHSDFVPADRHRGRYDGEPLPINVPSVDEMNAADSPMWVRNQRNSRHGVDFGYNLPNFSPEVYYRRYCESLLAVDESVGRLRSWLSEHSLAENTIVVYMGDNGFQFGDHGLIDKRTAYEASAKVPLIFAGGGIAKDQSSDLLVANIDIGPTLTSLAGTAMDGTSIDGTSVEGATIDGQSFADHLLDPVAHSTPIRDTLLYEYYWERNYPHTPTIHALIGGRYKYIRTHGLWDRDELYDLQNDPDEMANLIHHEDHQDRVQEMNRQLWQMLDRTAGNNMPLLEDRGQTFPMRDGSKSEPADFPQEFIRR